MGHIHALFFDATTAVTLRPVVLFAILILCFILLIQKNSSKNIPNSPHFLHHDGRMMRTLPGDARYTRFTHGYNIRFWVFTIRIDLNRKELSKAGQAMSSDDPYLLRNKSKRDLVLHTPAQMRDFFKGDGKRKSFIQSFQIRD